MCDSVYIPTLEQAVLAKRIQSPGLSHTFTDEEVEAARREGKLLSLDIQLTNLCNFRCRYCYATPNKRRKNELILDEVIGIIDQARELGLRTVTLTGGEPTLDEKFLPTVEYAARRGINVLVFTNASRITRAMARRLFDLRVSPCVKLDSLSPETQAFMAGKEDSLVTIRRGLDHLMAVGYTTTYPVLAVNAVLCQGNYRDIPELWRWARSQNITPSVSRLQFMGRARKDPSQHVSPLELKALYGELAEIDAHFGHFWSPEIPWHGAKPCMRYHIGGFVTSQGFLQPCSGVPLHAGSLRERSLNDLLSTAPVFRVARNIRDYLEGACGSCEYNVRCYGCRSIAYLSKGSFTATDPTCWRAYECEDRGAVQAGVGPPSCCIGDQAQEH